VFISKHPDPLAEAIISTVPSHDQASTPASAASSMMRDHGSMKYFPVERLWTTGLLLISLK
jgi:predicted NAD/FAD-binding protein